MDASCREEVGCWRKFTCTDGPICGEDIGEAQPNSAVATVAAGSIYPLWSECRLMDQTQMLHKV